MQESGKQKPRFELLHGLLSYVIIYEKPIFKLKFYRPAPDSLFSDVPNLDSRKAAEIAKDGE